MAAMTHRWYASRDDDDPADLERILTLIRDIMRQRAPEPASIHVGDVVWRLFMNLTIDPASCIRLFFQEQVLRGIVWLSPPRGFDVLVDPMLPDPAAAIAEMVRWGESQGSPDDDNARIVHRVEVVESDRSLRDALDALGYQRTGKAGYQLNARDLVDPIPIPELPTGASVRPVRFEDATEIETRVALHREVWAPSKITVEGYARLRTKPVYLAALDLVAVTPAGELASNCIVWWDPDTRVGEFEPVGTSERFRGQGYGKALMRDALRRLRELGAERAVVISATRSASEPARRLYASVGFTPVFRYEEWERSQSGRE